MDMNSNTKQTDSCNKNVQTPIFPVHKGYYEKSNQWTFDE